MFTYDTTRFYKESFREKTRSEIRSPRRKVGVVSTGGSETTTG